MWVIAIESHNASYVLDRDSNLPISKVVFLFSLLECVLSIQITRLSQTGKGWIKRKQAEVASMV